MKVYISLPAYNEETSLPRILQRVKHTMERQKWHYTLVVVDDGSRDKTAEVARHAGAIVYSHPTNYGLAETFRTEVKHFLSSGADVFVHLDADGQYNPEDIPRLVKEVEKGYDLVLSSRFLGKIEYMPFMKRWGNRAFARVLSRLTHYRLTDTTTGFRAFTRHVAENVPITTGFTYTQEQIIRAAREKYAIAEIAVDTHRTRESRLFRSSWEYAWKAWINIARIYRDYEPLKFFGRIGGILFLLGVFLGLYVFYNVITTGRAGGVPRVILSALLILSGIQIILFGFLADMWKK